MKIKRGSVLSTKGKTKISLFLDDDVLERFRQVATENGRGLQTEINGALRLSTGMMRPIVNNVVFSTVGQISTRIQKATAREARRDR